MFVHVELHLRVKNMLSIQKPEAEGRSPNFQVMARKFYFFEFDRTQIRPHQEPQFAVIGFGVVGARTQERSNGLFRKNYVWSGNPQFGGSSYSTSPVYLCVGGATLGTAFLGTGLARPMMWRFCHVTIPRSLHFCCWDESRETRKPQPHHIYYTINCCCNPLPLLSLLTYSLNISGVRPHRCFINSSERESCRQMILWINQYERNRDDSSEKWMDISGF